MVTKFTPTKMGGGGSLAILKGGDNTFWCSFTFNTGA